MLLFSFWASRHFSISFLLPLLNFFLFIMEASFNFKCLWFNKWRQHFFRFINIQWLLVESRFQTFDFLPFNIFTTTFRIIVWIWILSGISLCERFNFCSLWSEEWVLKINNFLFVFCNTGRGTFLTHLSYRHDTTFSRYVKSKLGLLLIECIIIKGALVIFRYIIIVESPLFRVPSLLTSLFNLDYFLFFTALIRSSV